MGNDGQGKESRSSTNLQLCKLQPVDAPHGLRLSRIAHWNQTLADWEFLLQEGTGFGFRTGDGIWVATLVALPLGNNIGWLSMVLVDPEWRRQGLASRLMQEGIRWLQERGLRPVLDATPEGETVYRNLGFSGQENLARWLLTPGTGEVPHDIEGDSNIRLVGKPDIGQLARWDKNLAGFDRKAVMEHLHETKPDVAFLAENTKGDLSGYIMGREGERATHLGPLVAEDPATARQLISAAVRAVDSPLYVDAFSINQPILAAGLGVHWSKERTFRRMAFGDAPLPGDPRMHYLAAGPELG